MITQVESSESLSLHLVLPPNTSSSDSSSAAATGPRQTHPPHAQIPPRPASTGHLPGGPGMRSFMQPYVNIGAPGAVTQPFPLPWQNPPFIPGQMQPPQIPPQMPPQMPPQIQPQMLPQMQEALNHHFAALSQQYGGQLGGGVPAPFNGIPPTHFHMPQQQIPAFPPLSFHQILAQQQQARAAARQQGINSIPGSQGPSQNLHPNTAAPQQNVEGSEASNNVPGQANGPGNNNTIIHEGQGPNGSQWRMVINESSIALPSLNVPPNTNQANPVMNSLGQDASRFLQAYTGMPMGPAFNMAPDLTNVPGLAHSLVSMQERLSVLEATLNNGGVLSEDDIYQAQLQFDDLWRQQPLFQSRPGILLQAQLLNIIFRASQARRRNVQNSSVPPPEVSAASPSMPQPTMQPMASSTVFLLSSPSGPQALLLSPSGMYASPGINAVQAGISLGLQPQQRLTRQIRLVNPANNINGQPRPVPPQNDQAVDQQQQQPQPNEARDLVRILLPLGGHLWLLIRLFGFVYFFTGGAGWRRIILLSICTLVIFIAQTGVFRPLQQAIWDPLRRHVEGLVPLGAPAAPANRGENEGQRSAGAQPNPRDMANRLLQERDGHDGSMLRRNLRRVERATALFVASLVPGVGERHIAARDAAEAARLAEEREREERLRREAEGSAQQEEIAAAVEHGEDVFTDAQENRGVGPEQVPQEAVAAEAMQ